MFKRFLGIFLIGLVIKIMDDYVDQDIDYLIEEWNITSVLKRGILPYSLVLLILSLYFNFDEATSLFLASYLLGMATSLKDKLPIHLLAWQEIIIILLICLYVTSFNNTISALLLISIIQCIDDIIDYRKDRYIKDKNLLNKLGKTNVIIITTIFILLALKFFPIKLAYFSIASLLIYFIFWLLKRDDQYDG